MSPQKLKKTLQKDLRAKRNKNRRSTWIYGFLLLSLLAAGGYLLWTKHRPAVLLQQGIRLEQQKKLTEALDRYQRLYEHYDSSNEAENALFRSGRILQDDLGQDQRALLSYLRLEKNYPRSKFVRQAQQKAAKLTKYRLGDCDQAIPIYQRLLEETKEQGDRYQYEIGDCYVRQENWSQAAIEFEALLGSYPQSDLRELVSYRLADARLLNHQPEQARAAFKLVLKNYPHSALAQEARFRLAEMLEEEEHLKEALQAFSKMTDYPRQDLLKEKILRLKKRMARKKKVL